VRVKRPCHAHHAQRTTILYSHCPRSVDHGLAGDFAPSPPTPLPDGGEGRLLVFQGCLKSTDSPLPSKGRGVGGEGKTPLPCGTTHSAQPSCIHIVHEALTTGWQGTLPPHPDPSPDGGEGRVLGFQGCLKSTDSPLPSKGTLPLQQLQSLATQLHEILEATRPPAR
jgi:hypothetical protein